MSAVQPQLVELLEVPARGAARAVDVEGHLALRADDRPARLERPAHAALELAQHPGVVLVGDRAGRVAGGAAAVVAGARQRERPLGDERRRRADDARDRPEQHVRQVDGVAEQVARDAVAALVELEAPGQQTERVAAVHREEAPAVVRDLAELTGVDQLAGVAHERRPAVVVTDAGRSRRRAAPRARRAPSARACRRRASRRTRACRPAPRPRRARCGPCSAPRCRRRRRPGRP